MDVVKSKKCNGMELEKENIKTGIIIAARWQPFSLWKHYGIIVVEEGRAYIYDNDPDNPTNDSGGSVGKFEIRKWFERRRLLEYYDSGLRKEEIENEVKKTSKEKFSWIFFNCKDFIRKITHTDHTTDFELIDNIIYPDTKTKKI